MSLKTKWYGYADPSGGESSLFPETQNDPKKFPWNFFTVDGAEMVKVFEIELEGSVLSTQVRACERWYEFNDYGAYTPMKEEDTEDGDGTVESRSIGGDDMG